MSGIVGSNLGRGSGLVKASSVTIANDSITLAKMAGGTDGNLITYDASGDPAYVASGTSGQFLKSQGANTVPVFAAAAGGGKILQVAYTVDSSPTTTSDNSDAYVTTGVSVAITPSATSSKIFLTWNHIFYDSGSSNDEIRMTFYRDSTQLGDCIMSQVGDMWIPSVMSYVDSPSSTSAITYAAYFMSNQGNLVYGANSSYNAVLTAWEIDGS